MEKSLRYIKCKKASCKTIFIIRYLLCKREVIYIHICLHMDKENNNCGNLRG